MITTYDRFLGAMFGLAYGDAIGFPALFHRFQATPRKRHDFLWRTNMELDQQRIIRLMLPYTHRLPAELLEPCPTDDTEFALLTLQTLVEADGPPSLQTFVTAWQTKVLPHAETVLSSFSERAALENLQRGLLPPATGNDNPLHGEDSAAIRAVPIGLYCFGQLDQAAALALAEAQLTQAEDGLYGAQAMAVAISLLADGQPLDVALRQARACFPAESWIAHVDRRAQECVAQADHPSDLALLLTTRVINTVYSFGSFAAETVPAALALLETCAGDLHTACTYASTIAKAADSLPALVGALCGAYQGIGVLSERWRVALTTCHGLCLPFMAEANLTEHTNRLYRKVTGDEK